MKYTNPILPGFYPDPSICKYNGKYYMVHSTFQYWPGVVLWESEDLLNWNQIGHVLTRQGQLDLHEAGTSRGVFAPTIRVNNGRFYMVTTNVSTDENFYVWTDDIHGEWSDPIVIRQDGIDPSFYFEGDKCYFMSNGTDDEGIGGITQCEIDINTGEILTPKKCIWQGNGGRFLEGPHLYKFGETYYLLAAEGGTEYGHMIVCATGSSPYGPFTGVKNNPILTNRNLGGFQIQGVGHGDLVEDNEGNLWMVHLAYRQLGMWEMFHTTGRETYLVPVTLTNEDGVPGITAGDNGTTRFEMSGEGFAPFQRIRKSFTFADTELGREWIFMRYPRAEKYVLRDWMGNVRGKAIPDRQSVGRSIGLLGVKDDLDTEVAFPTFMGIRQIEMKGDLTVKLGIGEEEAGVTLFMDPEHHYDLALQKTEKGSRLMKRICIGDLKVVQTSFELESAEAILKIHFEPTTYSFKAVAGDREYDLGSNRAKYLSTEVCSGFTGVLIGLYARSYREDCTKEAVFSDFSLNWE